MNLIHTSPEINKNVRKYFVEHFYGVDFDKETKRVFVADSRKGFFIAVFNDIGEEIYTINRKMEKLRIPDSYNRKKYEKLVKFSKEKGFWELSKNCKFVYDKYFPQILSFKLADGKIYVATYKRKNNNTEFLILDLKGKIFKKIFLPVKTSGELEFFPDKLSNYTINKGKLYQIVENDSTEIWELHIHGIN